MTCGELAAVSTLIVFPILTARRPVLGRHLSAVCSVQSHDPHCNVTFTKHLFTLKQLHIITAGYHLGIICMV